VIEREKERERERKREKEREFDCLDEVISLSQVCVCVREIERISEDRKRKRECLIVLTRL